MSTVLSLQVSYPQHLHFIYIPFVVGNEIRSPLNYNKEGPQHQQRRNVIRAVIRYTGYSKSTFVSVCFSIHNQLLPTMNKNECLFLIPTNSEPHPHLKHLKWVWQLKQSKNVKNINCEHKLCLNCINHV